MIPTPVSNMKCMKKYGMGIEVTGLRILNPRLISKVYNSVLRLDLRENHNLREAKDSGFNGMPVIQKDKGFN